MTHSRSLTRRLRWALTAVLPALALSVLLAPGARPANQGNEPIALVFLYGSEKQKWLEEVTRDFHDSTPTLNGRPIRVTAIPMGSGETVHELLEGGRQAHLISPASGAYLELGNAWAKDKKEPPLVGNRRNNLVLSPVVIAMWKPMAEALGWPNKEIGWADLRKLATVKGGWGALGINHPEFGAFKFGHTHPEMSNSGLIALLAQVYAATGKKRNLEVADVENAGTAAFLKELESSVVHYGESTGFFAKKMLDRGGRNFLSAAVLYENLVIESHMEPLRSKLEGEGSVVAIYPKEGTFLSDHPVAVVERDWVTPLHRKAAEKYIDFLLQDEQQRKALKYGFRPGVDTVPIAAPIDKEHGVDPRKPGANRLRPPEAKVMETCLETWKKYKKKASIVVVIDRSLATSFNDMVFKIQDGAEDLFDSLNPGDWVSVLAFGEDLEWLEMGKEIRDSSDKKALKEKLDSLEAKGTRKMFDAIAEAHRHLQQNKQPGRIAGVLVLACDAKDGGSKGGSSLDLEQLLDKIRVSDDRRNDVRVCVFAFATAKGVDDLKKIATATKAPMETVEAGTTKATVRKVLRKLATFF
jgi:Ca-activated chloride channel family protein